MQQVIVLIMFATACATMPRAPHSESDDASRQQAAIRNDCPDGYKPVTGRLIINDLAISVTACLADGETLNELCTRDSRDGDAFWRCPH